MTCEDISEVVGDGVSKLLLSSGLGTIWILEINYGVSSGSFDDGLMEEMGVPVSSSRRIFLVSLSMERFLFGKDGLMLEDKLFLDYLVPSIGRFGLNG